MQETLLFFQVSACLLAWHWTAVHLAYLVELRPQGHLEALNVHGLHSRLLLLKMGSMSLSGEHLPPQKNEATQPISLMCI